MLNELVKLLAILKKLLENPLINEKRYNKLEKALEICNKIPDVKGMSDLEKAKCEEIDEVLSNLCELYFTGSCKPDPLKRPELWALLNSICPCIKAKKLALNMPIGSSVTEPEIEKKPDIKKNNGFGR